jgi:methylphosphotriester-DNA--protein-cysteine methyltransferase
VNSPPRHQIGGYREYDPDAEAAFFSEAFWSHHTPAGEVAQGAAHRVLPDPALSVAFQARRAGDGRVREGAVVLIGPKTRPHLFPLVPGLELAAVRLKLEWVAPLLGIDPGGLDDRIVELSSLPLTLGGGLEEALAGTRSAREALPILARAIVETRASRHAPAPAATAAMEIVRRTAGRVPCERVAARLGLSMRHLRRLVRDSSGLSPKTYARVLRLAHAMQLADRAPRPDWAGVALAGGYCDQSHLIRECVAIAGSAPSQIHTERSRQRVAVAETSNPA